MANSAPLSSVIVFELLNMISSKSFWTAGRGGMTSNSRAGILRGIPTKIQLFKMAAQFIFRRWNWYKSYLACALGHMACLKGFSVRYYRSSRLLDDLILAHGDGSYSKQMESFLNGFMNSVWGYAEKGLIDSDWWVH